MARFLLNLAWTAFVCLPPTLAALVVMQRHNWLQRHLRPVAAVAVCGVAASIDFYAWLPDPFFGRAWTILVEVAAVVVLFVYWRGLREAVVGMVFPFFLTAVVLVFHVGMLHLWQTNWRDFDAAQHRMFELSVDNRLPFMLSNDLQQGHQKANASADGWQSSDRPPLQAGFLLFTLPPKTLGGGRGEPGGFAASVLFQGIWVLGLWAFLGQLRFKRRHRTVAVAFAGFFAITIIHDVFTWPKLATAGFLLAAFAAAIDRDPVQRLPRLLASSVFFGLAYLSHGGMLFSLLGGAVLVLPHLRKPAWREVVMVGVPIVVLVLPWGVWYQKIYEPPGDRLIKWHFAGITDDDPRSAQQAVLDQYRDLGISGTIHNKLDNFTEVIETDLDWIDPTTGEAARQRRDDEFRHPGTALGTAIILAGIVAVFAFEARRRGKRFLTRDISLAFWWFFWSTVIWLLLLFEPDLVIVHHGSFAIPLGIIALLGAIVARRSPPLFLAVFALQFFHFWFTWLARPVPTADTLDVGALEPRALVLTVGTGLILLALLIAGTLDLPRSLRGRDDRDHGDTARPDPDPDPVPPTSGATDQPTEAQRA